VVRGARRRQGAAGVRIEAVELARYVGPGRQLARPHGLVVRLRATTPAGPVTGVGEAAVAGDRTGPAWRALRQAGAALVGSALPDRYDPADPLAGVAGWRPVSAVDPGARRAAKLAVEMALLDLLMKANGLTPAEFWAVSAAPVPARVQTTHRLPRGLPGSARDGLTPRLRAEPDGSWAVRLAATGDPDLDLAWLREAAEIERRAGRDRPVWLADPALAPEAAPELVRRVAELVRDGALGEVLIEEPVARPESSRVAKFLERSGLAWSGRRPPPVELQRLADQVVGRGRCGSPGLTVLAGAGVVSLRQVHRLRGGGMVGGVHLSLPRFGTLVGLRRAAQAVKRADPYAVVLLGGARGSRITGSCLEALASATPEIDRYVPEPPVAGWPDLLADPARSGGRHPADRRAGLVAGVDLGELSTVVDDLAAFPEASWPAPAERPNRFPDYPPSMTLPVRTMLLETEALRAGLPTRRFARDVFLVGNPATGPAAGFFDSESHLTSAAASASAANKGVSRTLLAERGLPVPAGDAFPAGDRERAYAVAGELGFPLVVKPAGGSKGVAVTVGIGSPEELARALDEVAASRYAHTGVVVERLVTGRDYRVLATLERVLSVVHREPASVVGDGVHPVEELVLAANVARRQNPHLAKRVIVLDARVDDQLSRQGLTRRSVPAAGRRVRLRAEANLSLGGISREVLDSTHRSVRELAVAAVAAIPGLPYAGLDILMDDHRLPVDQQRVHIIEVNSRPVQSLHHFPMYGPPRNVSEWLVREVARAAGCAPRPGQDRLTVRLTVSGRVRGVGYRRWLASTARQLGLDGWVARSPVPDQIDAVAHGSAPRVGLLQRLAIYGPPGAGVVESRAEPVAEVPAPGFRIRKAASDAR
jgi:D-alanine-D-alanine ligase-like ATP-grasp enzyme/acylphosphatase